MRWGSSESTRSVSAPATRRPSSKASTSTTFARGRATTRRRPCPARKATPPSPATARRTEQPFGDLDQLAKGDKITVQTVQGIFTYVVDQDPFAVDPNDGDVLLPEPDPARPGHYLATLTLTTCNPKYSAAQRLIVKASLVLPQGAAPLPPSPGTSEPAAPTISGLSGDSRRGCPRSSGVSSSRSSGCSGGGSSTVTRAGRRGSWA